mmetsp:Transcript_30876/g.72137  ORF Transcript_30876/g.72137 Transcript_30876/m.72137 type:complete len:218 (+) Transcript_30876:433-1086(+)
MRALSVGLLGLWSKESSFALPLTLMILLLSPAFATITSFRVTTTTLAAAPAAVPPTASSSPPAAPGPPPLPSKRWRAIILTMISIASFCDSFPFFLTSSSDVLMLCLTCEAAVLSCPFLAPAPAPAPAPAAAASPSPPLSLPDRVVSSPLYLSSLSISSILWKAFGRAEWPLEDDTLSSLVSTEGMCWLQNAATSLPPWPSKMPKSETPSTRSGLVM